MCSNDIILYVKVTRIMFSYLMRTFLIAVDENQYQDLYIVTFTYFFVRT